MMVGKSNFLCKGTTSPAPCPDHKVALSFLGKMQKKKKKKSPFKFTIGPITFSF